METIRFIFLFLFPLSSTEHNRALFLFFVDKGSCQTNNLNEFGNAACSEPAIHLSPTDCPKSIARFKQLFR